MQRNNFSQLRLGDEIKGVLIITQSQASLCLSLTPSIVSSAANRSIGEVIQSRRKPLLAPTSAFTFKTPLRHYAEHALTHGK